METNYTSDSLLLQVDSGNITYLNEAAKWGKFLGIFGFVICALLVLSGIFLGTFLSTSFSEVNPEFKDLGSIGTSIFSAYFIVIALLYFFPSLYLFNFASKMQTALRTNDQISLNNSFKNLKSCFKFWGILLIIVLCVYALIIIFAILGGALFR